MSILSKIKYRSNNKNSASKVEYLRSQGAKIGEGCVFYCETRAFSTEPYLMQRDNHHRELKVYNRKWL